LRASPLTCPLGVFASLREDRPCLGPAAAGDTGGRGVCHAETPRRRGGRGDRAGARARARVEYLTPRRQDAEGEGGTEQEHEQEHEQQQGRHAAAVPRSDRRLAPCSCPGPCSCSYSCSCSPVLLLGSPLRVTRPVTRGIRAASRRRDGLPPIMPRCLRACARDDTVSRIRGRTACGTRTSPCQRVAPLQSRPSRFRRRVLAPRAPPGRTSSTGTGLAWRRAWPWGAAATAPL
jgi:hypothetical protein